MASKNIKGLTVEIGGDTTKLGKALQDVEKKSRDLSSELGQINRLLKMDPGNADLLAQKQQVLADAVENTRKKLETLKEAERQVQQQFERGEVSEEQVRALQREIIATTKKMDSYEQAARETADAVDKLGDDSEDAGDEAKKAAKNVDDFGDAADRAEQSSGKLGSTLVNAAKVGFAAVAAAAGALITGLVASAEATREYRTEMGKLDTAFTTNGHSSEAAVATYKSLQGVLGETDQAVEAANHLAKLTKNEQDLQKWTDICTGVYATFGASLPIEGLTEAANETAKVGQVTGPLADALNWAGVSEDAFNEKLAACSTEQQRQALIMETLNGLYTDAATKYRETNAEVIRANEANEAWTASMAEVGGAIEPILTDIKMMGASLLSEAVPGVKALAEAFRGLLNGEEGASGDFGAALSGMVTGLVTKITELLPTVAEVGVSIITTLVTSLGQQLPTLLSTGGQIIFQLLSGIASNLPSIAQGALNAIGGFVQGLQTNLPLVLAKGREILMNLATGIKDNLPNLVSQALDIIMNFATTIYDNAPTLIKTGFDVLSNLVQGILDSLPVLLSKAPEIISKFANVINDNFPTILKKGVELIWQIIKGIISAIPTLIANIPKIITAIVDVWEAFNWVNLGKNAIKFLKDGIVKMVGAVKGAGKNVLDAITNALKSLPSKLGSLGQSALNFLKNAINNARSAVASAGGNILNAIINAIKNLPSKLLERGKSAISKMASALSSGVATVKGGAAKIFNGIVDYFKTLPSKLLGIGKDLVRGLWNGISDMTGWVIGKIQGFGSSVLGGIKKFFGIKSPSRVFRDEVGAMLAEGMAEGIEENADAPLDAMAGLSSDLLGEADGLNGLTLQRKLNTTFANTGADSATSGLLGKLDSILAAIERGQIITIDGKQLVGATAAGYDSTLGQRRALVARGAL